MITRFQTSCVYMFVGPFLMFIDTFLDVILISTDSLVLLLILLFTTSSL